MSPTESDLIDAYLDGRISPEDGNRLEDLLASDSEARASLRRRATINEFLTESASVDVTRAHPHHLFDRETGKPKAETATSTKWTPAYSVAIPWVIAAVLAFLLVGIYAQNSPDSPTTSSSDSFIGLLVDEAEAEFEAGYGPKDFIFDIGEYRLKRGAIHVRLVNGTDIVMKSPVSFRIEDPLNFLLQQGELRAIVPEAAEGFTVLAPGVDYVDLGTEFGISVDRETGSSELHVFDGEVSARDSKAKTVLSSVTEGESVSFTKGSMSAVDSADEDRFLTLGTIGLLRWNQGRQEIERDADLIAFYPFTKADKLRNTAENRIATDGSIEGAHWVSGRWPGKAALLFDRDSDFVELDLPGEFTALTFSAWIKVDRLERNLHSLLNSNGSEDGDVHWDINPEGRQLLIRRFHDYGNLLDVDSIVPVGQWTHLAGTISVDDQEMRVYQDGELVGLDRVPMGILTPGKSRIGQWLSPYHIQKRSFRGRMDEFAIWKRVLSASEIKALTDAGKPDKIWSMESK
ncbi:MAG: LamG-like jellyroll fold domain-containing protein [Planctomycetota bacterium]